MIRIGVDTGGTFTDLVLVQGSQIVTHKVRSTPDDPSRAILKGLSELSDGRVPADVVHGSTVATNAVLERKGARVALLATEGFEDVLRIGRQTRSELYDFLVQERRPLVDAELTFGVRERIAADGSVLTPFDAGSLDDIVTALHAARVEAVAVCLLHAYANPAHEQAIEVRLTREGFDVSASHRVLPEYREFERCSTTAVNAYVTPLMARYLTALEARLGPTRLSIMQSNGGSISAARAKTAAVQTILSGPAAGAVGAQAVGSAAGYPRVIGLDMGGTSTDVTLIDVVVGVTTESVVGGFPVRLPVIDIHTVGAGGGSIAYLDTGGALRVGPHSAGAVPGPVCYGTGTELTVTDANLLLGRLDTGHFLGGRMTLAEDRTREIAARVAASLDLSVMELAEGIVRIANSNMERAIRVVSVQKGYDPRDFALLAFGGAGGMHACAMAETLNIDTVLVPRFGGVLSALGMLLADVTKDYSQTLLRGVDETTMEEVETRFAPLVDRALSDLSAEGYEGDRAIVERSLDVRYVGQAYEIAVAFGPEYRGAFDAQHKQLYGYANPQRAAEIVALRVRAIGVTDKPALPSAPPAAVAVTPTAVRDTWFEGRPWSTAVYRRDSLPAGARGTGPALISGPESTIVVPPGFQFHMDPHGNTIVTRRGSSRELSDVPDVSGVLLA